MAHYHTNGKKDTTTIINGAFTDEAMMKTLDRFIMKYVCCPGKPKVKKGSKYPEMHLTVRRQKVAGQCDSCGFSGELDNNHKLATFIIKNPPKSDEGPNIK